MKYSLGILLSFVLISFALSPSLKAQNAFTFSVKPNQRAIVSVEFQSQNHEEMDVDLLKTGTYVQTPDGCIAKRMDYRNSGRKGEPPMDTGINKTASPVSYDIRASFKVFPGGQPWHFCNNPSYVIPPTAEVIILNFATGSPQFPLLGPRVTITIKS